jgi:multimeric flavodoxin WrbA
MKKLLTVIIALMMVATSLNAKTLIVYYSFTNNIRTVVNELSTQIEADVLEVLPTEENVDYAANNYAIGSALISAIRNNPNDASSYPAIKTTINNLADYNTVIIATPLWWSNMAAPMQTFLFTYGAQMAGKNIGLIVSSASSGISGVESDAKRLIPEGNFLESNLWIRSSQTSNAASLISSWLNDIHYNDRKRPNLRDVVS